MEHMGIGWVRRDAGPSARLRLAQGDRGVTIPGGVTGSNDAQKARCALTPAARRGGGEKNRHREVPVLLGEGVEVAGAVQEGDEKGGDHQGGGEGHEEDVRAGEFPAGVPGALAPFAKAT